jgi:CubicO group peptidase (beta-lactamase class C family)
MTTFEQVAAKIDEYMLVVENKEFSGAILVARDGQPIFHKGYGQASIELHVPNTAQTVFRIGSITKQFTGMAVMMLQERGKLAVTDSICDHLTNCPETWKPVTVHHLLVHSSGIPCYMNTEENFKKTVVETLEHDKMIDLFRDSPLEFVPGEKFKYSNAGYHLLGVIIENLSGQSYERFLQENIFGPLEMTNTTFDSGEKIINNLATGYSRIDGRVSRMPITGLNAFAAGALVSNCEDLLKWDRALYSEKLGSNKSRDEMFTPFSSFSDEIGYGYGWFVGTFQKTRQVFHGGRIFGYVAYFARFPEVETTVIALSNNGETDVEKVALGLAAIVVPSI